MLEIERFKFIKDDERREKRWTIRIDNTEEPCAKNPFNDD